MIVGINKYMIIRDLAATFILGILLGHLFSIPIIIWRILFVLLIVMVIIMNFRKLNMVEGFVVALTLYCSVVFLVYFSPEQITRYGAILYTVPALILFNYLDSKGVITQRWINVWSVIFLVAAIVFYRYKESTLLDEYFEYADQGFTNNASTVFVGLLAFLLLCNKKIVVWIGFALCWFFLLLSSKRGNIVEAFIPTMVLFFLSQQNRKRKALSFLLTIIVFAVGIYLGLQVFGDNQYLVDKVDESGLNGRDVIWGALVDEWSKTSNLLKCVFGYGLTGTVDLSGGMPAHNDWLEILVDFGLVGFALQIGIFVSLFKLFLIESPYRLMLVAPVGIWLVKSMISMGFTDPLNVFTFVSLGILMSRTLKTKKNLVNGKARKLYT